MGMMDKQIDKLAERAREFLGPEVNVRFALVGMGRSPYLAGAGLLGFLLGKWRAARTAANTLLSPLILMTRRTLMMPSVSSRNPGVTGSCGCTLLTFHIMCSPARRWTLRRVGGATRRILWTESSPCCRRS